MCVAYQIASLGHPNRFVHPLLIASGWNIKALYIMYLLTTDNSPMSSVELRS